MLAHFLAAPVNHVLRGETWALRRLAPFAGRTARFDLPPLRLDFIVRDGGEVAPAPPGAVPDLTLTASPFAAARIMAGDENAYAEVRVEGDTQFAQAVQLVLRNARWDAEEDLARFVGDSAAHRLAAAGRSALELPRHAARRLARNLSDYWLEEAPLIARRDDLERWVREVDTLRDDVERLAHRIARL